MESPDQKEYLTTLEASRRSAYSSSYIRFLARTGKISAIRKENAWLVAEEDLSAYETHIKEETQSKLRALAEQRKTEYRMSHAAGGFFSLSSLSIPASAGKAVTAAVAFLMLSAAAWADYQWNPFGSQSTPAPSEISTAQRAPLPDAGIVTTIGNSSSSTSPRYIYSTIVERTIVEHIAGTSGVSEEELQTQLLALRNDVTDDIFKHLRSSGSSATNNTTSSGTFTGSSLDSVAITNSTFQGTSIDSTTLAVSGVSTLANVTAAHATSTSLFTSSLGIGNDYLTDVTGYGLAVVNGELTVTLSASPFATTTADYWLTTKTTDDLAQGSTNRYFSNGLADARINATSTISTLTSAPNLGTVSTALSGILKASAGVLSSAVSGTDYQAPGAYITSLTGDGTASGPGASAFTLATVNSNVGTFNNVTVNAKGLVTAASNVSYLTGNQTITLSGDVTGSGTTGITTTLATVNGNVGSFGSASSIPTFTVNAKGLVTAAGSVTVIAPAGTLTGATLASNVLASSLTSVGTLSALTVSGNTTLANATTTSLFSINHLTNTFSAGQTGTTTISSTGALTTPSLTIGTLSGVLKASSGVVSSAVSGTDYAPATSGSSLLYGNGAGGFSNATISSPLSFAGGTLSLSTTGDWTGTFDGIEGAAYLSRANHTGTQLSSTISDFSSTARGLFSSTATGLTYTSGTGVFSLTGGYNIPLTASTTDWNTAYLNRITSATAPLSISGNAISLSQSGVGTDGYLSTTDWNTFNNKQNLLTGTTGQFGYFSGTNTFTATSSLFMSATGNVGIGTTTPATLLSIAGATPSITLRNTSALGFTGKSWQLRVGATGIGSGTSFDIFDVEANTSMFGILRNTFGDGQVLVGTTTNSITGNNSRLFVFGGANGANIDAMGDKTQSGGVGDSSNIEAEGSDWGTVSGGTSSIAIRYYGPSFPNIGTILGAPYQRLGVLDFGTASSSAILTQNTTPIRFGINNTEVMRLTTVGLGIGTTTPGSALAVQGNGLFSGNLNVANLTATGTATTANLTIGSLSGILKATSGVVSAAVSGTDYAPATSGSSLLYGNGSGGFSNASISSPLTFSAGALGIQVANTSQNGYLSSTDWNTFNGKQNLLTGTTGQFGYFSGTNTFTATSTLFLASSGNVGIGTTNPQRALHISGAGFPLAVDSSNSNGLKIGLYDAGSIAGYIGGTSATPFIVANSAATPLVSVLIGGNVGIGTTTPTSILSISGSSAALTITDTRDATFSVGDVISSIDFRSNDASNSLAGAIRAKIGTITEDIYGTYTGLAFSTHNGTTLSEKLRITNTGNVGIGTTSPTSLLTIGPVAANPSNIYLAAPTNYSAGVYFNTGGSALASGIYSSGNAQDVRLMTQATDRLVVTLGGNVGIGTSAPKSILQVGSAYPGIFNVDTTNGTDTRFGTNFYYSGGWKRTVGSYVAAIGMTDGVTTFSNAAWGSADTAITWSPTVTIDNAGNLGVGTTTPQNKLSVTGTIESDTAGYALRIYNSARSQQNGYIYSAGAELQIDSASAQPFGLFAGGTRAITMLTSGSVGIGTASPSQKLEVNGDIAFNANAQYLRARTSAGTGTRILGINGANDLYIGSIDAAANDMLFVNSGVTKMVLTSGGNLGIGITSPNTYLANSTILAVGNIGAGLSGQIGVVGNLTSDGTIGDFTFHNEAIGSGDRRVAIIRASRTGANNSSALQFYTANAGALGEAMRISAAGYVGIGTANPQEKLEVRNGNISFYDGYGIWGGGSSKNAGFTTSSGALSFRSGSTDDRMVITSGGSVGIGTTNPGFKLEVKGGTDVTYPQTVGQLSLTNSDSMAINKGGLLSFSGSFTGTTQTTWASIGGLKENSTDSNYAGYLGFYTRPQGDINQERMRITSTGNVGIGIAAPGAKLDVNGTIISRGDLNIWGGNGSNSGTITANSSSGGLYFGAAGTNQNIRIVPSGTGYVESTATIFSNKSESDTPSPGGLNGSFAGPAGYWQLRGAVNHSLNFDVYNSGAQIAAMTILQNGNVGIGSVAPNARLSVNAGTGAYPTLGTNVTNSLFVGRSDSVVGTYFGYSNDGNGWIQQMRNDNATAYNLILQPVGGSVGIGVASPNTKLEIRDGAPVLRLQETTTGGDKRLDLGVTSAGIAYIGANQSGQTLQFQTVGAERMRIDANGAVGIGNTSPWYSGSYAALSLGSSSALPGLIKFGSTYNTGNGAEIYQNSGGTLIFNLNGSVALVHMTSGSSGIRFNNYGAGTLQTDASGNISASSDVRLKNVDGDFSRGLVEIMTLNPILYHWNAASGLDRTTQYAGFSAQNVQSSIPEAVGHDASGYLSLSDRPILAASVNAIKELAGRTDRLSVATTTLGTELQSLSSAFAASKAESSQARDLTATNLTATTFTVLNTASVGGQLLAASISTTGTQSASAFLVPMTSELPPEVLTQGRADLYKMASYSIVGITTLSNRIDTLSMRVDSIEQMIAALNQNNGGAGSTTQEALNYVFGQWGISITDVIAKFRTISAERLFAAADSTGQSFAGSGIIESGETYVQLQNSHMTSTSKVIITLTSTIDGYLYVDAKGSGTFKVNASRTQNNVVTFDYIIIDTDSQMPVPRAVQTQTQTPAPADPAQSSTPPAPTPAPSSTSTTTTPNPPAPAPAPSPATLPESSAPTAPPTPTAPTPSEPPAPSPEPQTAP